MIDKSYSIKSLGSSLSFLPTDVIAKLKTGLFSCLNSISLKIKSWFGLIQKFLRFFFRAEGNFEKCVRNHLVFLRKEILLILIKKKLDPPIISADVDPTS